MTNETTGRRTFLKRFAAGAAVVTARPALGITRGLEGKEWTLGASGGAGSLP